MIDPISIQLKKDYYDKTFPQYGATRQPKIYQMFELMLMAQEAKGLEKYGQTISQYDGGVIAKLNHASEELTDLMVYLRSAMDEMEKDPASYSGLLNRFTASFEKHDLLGMMTVLLTSIKMLQGYPIYDEGIV